MKRIIQNIETDEEVTLIWTNNFDAYSTESEYEGRFFADMGDGRLYEATETGSGEAWVDAS
jgi:hypothetical protein